MVTDHINGSLQPMYLIHIMSLYVSYCFYISYEFVWYENKANKWLLLINLQVLGLNPGSAFVCLHVQREVSLDTLSSSLSLKTCRLYLGWLETLNWLVDTLATCPGCTLPLLQCQLGLAPFPLQPSKDKWYRYRLDGLIFSSGLWNVSK